MTATTPEHIGHEDDIVLMGHIAGVYGVKGWLKIHSHTAPRDNILNYNPWLLSFEGGAWEAREVLAGRRQGKGIVARIAGVDDRDQARLLIGTQIAIKRDQLAPLPEGEYYWHELIGLKVVNLQDIELGCVDHLFETGANDVLVVKGERERLIPYAVGPIVKDIDLAAGCMRVDWQPED